MLILALETVPNLITARLLQVELHKREFERTKNKLIYKQLEINITKLFADGYLELPELMYSEQPKTVGLDSTYTPFAQENIREGTPTGKGTVLTLSNGRYDEFKNVKRIETIGSVRFDTEKKKIVGFGENKRQVEVVSRFLSVDPLAQSYPFYSPYQFAGNKPIIFIDIDGAEEGFNMRFEQMQVGYLKGKVTEKELKDFNKANAAGALVGAGVVGAAYAAPIVASAASKYGVGLMLNPVAQANIIGFFYGLAGGEDNIPGTGGDDVGRYVRRASLLPKAANYGKFSIDIEKYVSGSIVAKAKHISGQGDDSFAVFTAKSGSLELSLNLTDDAMKYGTGYMGEDALFGQLYNAVTKNGGIVKTIFSTLAKDNLAEFNHHLKALNIKGIPTHDDYKKALSKMNIYENAQNYDFKKVSIDGQVETNHTGEVTDITFKFEKE